MHNAQPGASFHLFRCTVLNLPQVPLKYSLCLVTKVYLFMFIRGHRGHTGSCVAYH